MEKKTNSMVNMRSAICLVLVGLYIVGMIFMIALSFRVGVILWVISTMGGIGLLYWVRTLEKRAEDAKAAAEGKFSEDEEGVSDDSCE